MRINTNTPLILHFEALTTYSVKAHHFLLWPGNDPLAAAVGYSFIHAPFVVNGQAN